MSLPHLSASESGPLPIIEHLDDERLTKLAAVLERLSPAGKGVLSDEFEAAFLKCLRTNDFRPLRSLTEEWFRSLLVVLDDDSRDDIQSLNAAIAWAESEYDGGPTFTAAEVIEELTKRVG